MKTLKITLCLFLAIVATSCDWDINIGRTNGNGNVTTEERTGIRDFDAVKGSSGLNVILTKGTQQKVVVEADENLQEIIETYVENGTLRITVEGNIGNARAKKVYVTFTNLEKVQASSGANVYVQDELRAENLTLDASSGANLEASVFSKDLYLEASSGANLEVSGIAKTVKTKASSGASIDAQDVVAATGSARASSGASIAIQAKETLETKTSSGGQINYYGNPTVSNSSSKHSNGVHKM